jgi:cytosine/adenosine deaminase-related metal-dependent hydrolase
MFVFRAAWICPISKPPIQNGWVAIDDDRIARVGGAGEPPPKEPVRDLGDVAVLPGVINAHTHLELSWLRGRVPPAAEFVDWIKQLLLTRGGRSERVGDAKVVNAALQAAREAREYGTAAVGDISNSLATVEPIRDAGLAGVVFHELLGFDLTDGRSVDETRAQRLQASALAAEHVRVSICPHAPYSVSPELFRAIREEVGRSPVPITSVHLGESMSEIQFLENGGGPWPGMLRFVGSLRDDWVPPGTGPVEYLESLGMLDAHTLVVHGVQLQHAALQRLAEIGCTLVTCPRSNQWVGAGVPPIERFYASGIKVAVGTDSLASVEDLNIFAELKAMRWLAPSVPARQLLESATLTGARALGLGDQLGSIEAGKRAQLIAINLPPHLVSSSERETVAPADVERERVEEHLVSGVDPRDIRWVAA